MTGWGTIIEIIAKVVGPLVVDLVKALVDGDADAYQRVADIVPAPMSSRVLLEHERARLEALRAADAAGDD